MVDPANLRAFPHSLVGAIYSSPTQETPWIDALELLRTALKANVACLRISIRGSSPREYLFAAGPRASREAIAEWEARRARELLPLELRPGETRVVDWSELAPSAEVSEMLTRYDVASTVVMLLAVEDGVEYLLQASRGGSGGLYTAAELSLFSMIGDHFGRALKLRNELVSAQVVNRFQSDALDRLGIAAILVSSDGRFNAVNKAAQRVLADNEGLRVCGGRLRTVDGGDDRLFQSILKEVLTSGRPDCSRAMLIKSGGEGRDLNLLVSARQSLSVVSHRAETCALVFVRRSVVANDSDVEVLQQLFSFTRAEARLALGLAKGKRLEDVEAELNITHNTARAHLRSMFVKADVNRQSELVHVLANSVAPLGRPVLDRAPEDLRLTA